jgi:uncharacterized membrane protein
MARREMTDRALSRLAWLVCVLTLLVLAASLILILLGWSAPLPEGATPWRDRAIALIGVIGAPVVGGLIASRRPRNVYGWLWLGFGLGLALQQLAQSYRAYARVAEPGTLVAPLTISEVTSLGGPISLALAPFLILLFPTGRLPGSRWRPLAWIAAVSGTVIVIIQALFEDADKRGGLVTTTVVAAVLVTFGAFAVSALSLVFRYRRASGVERQQLKWFAYAAVLGATFLVAQQLAWIGMLLIAYFLGVEPLGFSSSLENLLNTAINVCFYAGVGVAILRYRLYDIDILINRTLVYAALTVSLALVYFGGVVTTQTLFRAITGQERLPQLAVVISTLAIAALFNPFRRRIQSTIDRRFYRRKYDAAKTLESFSTKLRDETDLDELSGDLVRVVHDTVQPEHVSLWVRGPEESG